MKSQGGHTVALEIKTFPYFTVSFGPAYPDVIRTTDGDRLHAFLARVAFFERHKRFIRRHGLTVNPDAQICNVPAVLVAKVTDMVRVETAIWAVRLGSV